MKFSRVMHVTLDVSSASTVPAESGFLVSPDGWVALVERGCGSRASLSTESCLQLIQALLTVLPTLEQREAPARYAVSDALAQISGERH